MDSIEIQDQPRPKVDFRRVLIDLWRRSWMLVIVAGLALAAAYFGGKRFSSQTYETQTTLVYRLNDEKKADTDAQKNLLTLKSIVKVRRNLEEVRNDQKLTASLQQIGAAIEVDVEKNTNLMVISATWNDPEGAANLANGVRDVFLRNQVDIDRIQAQRELEAGKRRLDVISGELAKADQALQQFANQHQVTDFVSMARAYLEGYNSVDLLYQSALVEQETNREQVANMERIVRQQKAKVQKDKDSAASMQSMTNLGTRIEKLREAIHDDKELRARQADLALRELELGRQKKLFTEGVVSKRSLDEAQAAYDKQKALTVETDQIKVWRQELEKLQATVLPTNSAPESAQLLQEMLSKDFNLQLNSVAIESKVASLKAARDDYDRKLAEMPDLQRTFAVLTRRAETLEAEKKTLDENMAKANRLLEIKTPDFITVSPAKLPSMPKTSNRKTMSMMFGFLVGALGLAAVAGSILMDPRVKTKGDLAAASRMPVLSELPNYSRKLALFPPPVESPVAVSMSTLSRAIRRMLPQKGARIAFAGIHQGNGASSLAASVATALARQGESVLLVAFSAVPNAVTLAASDLEPFDWVSEVDESGESLVNFVRNGGRGVPSVLPPLLDSSAADSLTSLAMRNELSAIAALYDVVILDLQPAHESVQVELLGSFCDGVVFATKSLHLRRETVRRLEGNFENAQVPSIGWVLNCVPRMYQERL